MAATIGAMTTSPRTSCPGGTARSMAMTTRRVISGGAWRRRGEELTTPPAIGPMVSPHGALPRATLCRVHPGEGDGGDRGISRLVDLETSRHVAPVARTVAGRRVAAGAVVVAASPRVGSCG